MHSAVCGDWRCFSRTTLPASTDCCYCCCCCCRCSVINFTAVCDVLLAACVCGLLLNPKSELLRLFLALQTLFDGCWDADTYNSMWSTVPIRAVCGHWPSIVLWQLGCSLSENLSANFLHHNVYCSLRETYYHVLESQGNGFWIANVVLCTLSWLL